MPKPIHVRERIMNDCATLEFTGVGTFFSYPNKHMKLLVFWPANRVHVVRIQRYHPVGKKTTEGAVTS